MKPGIDVPVRYRGDFNATEALLTECLDCLAMVRVESLTEHMKRMHSGVGREGGE